MEILPGGLGKIREILLSDASHQGKIRGLCKEKKVISSCFTCMEF